MTHSFKIEIQVDPPSPTHCSVIRNGKRESCIFLDGEKCLVFWEWVALGGVHSPPRCRKCLDAGTAEWKRMEAEKRGECPSCGHVPCMCDQQ